MNNALYLRRRNRVLLPAAAGTGSAGGTARLELLAAYYVASAARNLEGLGYTFSPELIQAARILSAEEFGGWYRGIEADLTPAKGAHRTYLPFYPNFPQQVMEMCECELYLNALLH